MRTILKFFVNPHRASSDIATKFISRTMGKIAFPLHETGLDIQGGFVVCDILEETLPGQPKGCFRVDPVKCLVDPSDLPFRLPPGSFSVRKQDSIAIVTPEIKAKQGRTLNAILPKLLMQNIMSETGVYAVIVRLGGNMDWSKQ